MLPTTKRIADFHRQVIAHAGRTHTHKGGLREKSAFVFMGVQKKNQDDFLSLSRSLSAIIAINSEFVGLPRAVWMV